MEQPLTSNQQQQNKKGLDCFSFESSVVIAHYISLISNIILFLILIVSGLKSKWIGIILHLIWGGLLYFILKIVHHYSVKHLNKLKLFYKLLGVTILGVLIFYICTLVDLRKTELDDQFVIFFIFCFTILMFYHILFGVIIYRYLKFIVSRPRQKDNKIFVDKNLNDLILNSNEAVFIS